MATRKVNARPETTSTWRVHAGAWNFCFNHAKYEYMATRKVNAYPESRSTWRAHGFPDSKCPPVE